MKKFTLTLFLTLFVFTFDAFSAVKIWDGGGADDNWRTAANWVDDVAPAAGDDLVFPETAAKFTANNNLTLFTTIRSVRIEGGNYTIGGSLLRLSGGLTVNAGTNAVNIIISLTAPQTFLVAGTSVTTIAALILGNNALALDVSGGLGVGLISGTGAMTKTGLGGVLITAASNYSGAVAQNDGILIVDAVVPNSPVTINANTIGGSGFKLSDFGLSDFDAAEIGASGFGGTGTVGAVNVTRGIISAGTVTSPTGILNTGNLTFTPDGGYVVKIAEPAAGENGYDQLNVGGAVNLNDALLTIAPLNGYVPVVGTSFTILNNDGSEAIVGKFLNLPESTTFNVGTDMRYIITYRGGDGNDVVITRVKPRRGRL